MRFRIENHGVLKSATIDIGNLTVVCGKNNTGKSYLTYSLYGAMEYLTRSDRYNIPEVNAQELLSTGSTDIDLIDVVSKYWEQLGKDDLSQLRDVVPSCIGTKGEVSSDLVVKIAIDRERELIEHSMLYSNFAFPFKMHEGYEITFQKSRGCSKLGCRYVPGQSSLNLKNGASISIPASVVANVRWVAYALAYRWLPRPFILGSERTGVSVFRDEFNAFRSIAYESDDQSDMAARLKERFSFSDYPVSVRKDLEFSMHLANVVKSKPSFLDRYKELFDVFEGIAGGRYDVDSDSGVLRFTPAESSGVRLSISESSSSVRSLCELYFYMKYCARKGDVLIIDEPELNLHPSAQRRLARFFAMLVSHKIRVFITTHSDYIIREINAMVNIARMADDARNLLIKKYGYSPSMMIKPEDVRFYVLADGHAEGIDYDVDVNGFGIRSFDDTIEEFNCLYNDIKEMGYGQEISFG